MTVRLYGVPAVHSRSRKLIQAMQVLQTEPDTSILPAALPTFRVRDIPVYGDAILAPMDGFSDWPFRSICRGLGSAMSYNEFTRAEFILHGFEHISERFTYDEVERPFVIQVYGDDPELIIAAALRVHGEEARHHRHQHGLPGAHGRQPRRRRGADAHPAQGGAHFRAG